MEHLPSAQSTGSSPACHDATLAEDGQETLLARLLAPLFALFLVMIPLLYWSTTDSYRARVVLFSLPLLICGAAIPWRKPPPLNNWMRAGLGCALLGLFIAAVFAERQFAAWLRVIEILWCLGLATLAAVVAARQRSAVFVILAAIATAYTISNLRLLLEWASLEDPRSRDWTFAVPGYFHYRNLGFAAAPALILLAWMPFAQQVRDLESRRRLLARTSIGFAAALGWGVLAWSGSRAGLLCSIVGIGLLAIAQRQRLPMGKYLGSAGGSAAIGALASAPFIPYEGSFGIIRIARRAIEGGGIDEYSSGRITLYLDGLRRLGETWLLGLGPDQYQSQYQLPSRLLEPHNAVLQIGFEAGGLGLLGAAVFLAGCLRFVWSRYRRLSREGDREEVAILGALLIAFALFAMIDGVLFWMIPQTGVAALAGCLWGTLARGAEVPGEPEPSPSYFRMLRPGLAVLAAIAATAFLIVHKQSGALEAPGSPDPQSLVARSIYRMPGSTWGVLSWMQEWETAGQRDVAEAWYQRMIEVSPAPYYYRTEYGYFLVRNQRYDEALREIERGLDEAPLRSVHRMRSQNGELISQLRAVVAEAP